MKTTVPGNVDAYIAGFPAATAELLQQMRQTVREAAPEAEESIKYAMPAYTFNGSLVYFAGYKTYIGFYPTPSGIEAFREALSGYKGAKGSVQFPLDQPLPLDLVRRIVQFRVEENAAKPGRKKVNAAVKKK